MRSHLVLAALVALSPACKKKSKSTEENNKPAVDKTAEATKTPADAAPKAAAPAAVADKKAKIVPLLWKITAPGSSAEPSYLFGTFHAEIGIADIPDSVLKILDGTKTYVMEADQTKMDQGELMKLMMLPPNRSLDKELPPEVFKKLVEHTKLPEAALRKMQPWFVALTIALKFYTVGVPIDMQLRTRAQSANKQVGFLEGWRDAIDVLSAGTAKDLIELANDIEKARKNARQLLAAYRAGDVDKVVKLVFDPEEMKKQPKIFEGLFFKRNRAWMPKIEAHIKTGGVFIAVGSGHIVGAKGLLDLLGKKGYKSERIR